MEKPQTKDTDEDNIGFLKTIFKAYCKLTPNDQELGAKIRHIFK